MSKKIFREFVLSKGNYSTQIAQYRSLKSKSKKEIANYIYCNLSTNDILDVLSNFIIEELNAQNKQKIRITEEQLNLFKVIGYDIKLIPSATSNSKNIDED